VGGSGAEGGGLALRWAKSSHSVLIGSRDADKARAAAVELNELLGADNIQGMGSREGVTLAHIIVLAQFRCRLSKV
jgi:predicted dinucleotide-binding enzyme